MSKRGRWWNGETDRFEVSVCETNAMEVLQTLSCPMQLSLHFSAGGAGESEATCQFQSVGMIILDELHDVPA